MIAEQSAIELAVLGELPDLRELRLERLSAELDLGWLALSRALRTVDICDCWGGITFVPFEGGMALDWMMLDESEADLSNVRSIGHLVIARVRSSLLPCAFTGCQRLTVVASDVEVVDLPTVAESVELVNCPRVRKVRNAAECQCTSVKIASCPKLDDLSFLAELPRLQSLWLHGQAVGGDSWRIPGLAHTEIRVCEDMAELRLHKKVARLIGASDVTQRDSELPKAIQADASDAS